MSYLIDTDNTKGKAFGKLAEDARKKLLKYEDEIRDDCLEKVKSVFNKEIGTCEHEMNTIKASITETRRNNQKTRREDLRARRAVLSAKIISLNQVLEDIIDIM